MKGVVVINEDREVCPSFATIAFLAGVIREGEKKKGNKNTRRGRLMDRCVQITHSIERTLDNI